MAVAGIEAVLLTGGKSERMGSDKSNLLCDGVSLGVRIADELAQVCDQVTVLGNHPIEGYRFVGDRERYQGPLAALASLSADQPLVFIASCDLVLFQAGIVRDLEQRIGAYQACIPIVNGQRQPLCALYRAEALASLQHLVESGERRLMVWVDSLPALEVEAETLSFPLAVHGANTRDEFEKLAFTKRPPNGRAK